MQPVATPNGMVLASFQGGSSSSEHAFDSVGQGHHRKAEHGLMVQVPKIPPITGHQDVGLLGQGGCKNGNILARQSATFGHFQMRLSRLDAYGNTSDQSLQDDAAIRPFAGHVAAGLFHGQP